MARVELYPPDRRLSLSLTIWAFCESERDRRRSDSGSTQPFEIPALDHLILQHPRRRVGSSTMPHQLDRDWRDWRGREVQSRGPALSSSSITGTPDVTRSRDGSISLLPTLPSLMPGVEVQRLPTPPIPSELSCSHGLGPR